MLTDPRSPAAQLRRIVDEFTRLTPEQKSALLHAAPELYLAVARFARTTEVADRAR